MQEFTDTIPEIESAAAEPAIPDPAASPNDESRRKKTKGSTAAAGAVVALVVAGTVGYGMLGGGSTEKATVRTTSTEPDAFDAQTKAAIAMIQADGTSVGPGSEVATTAASDEAVSVPAVDLATHAGTIAAPTPETMPAPEASADPGPEPREAPSKASKQRSIYLGAAPEPRASQVDARAVQTSQTAKAPAPVKPPFNTLLPVRTLGTILTVRSGGLARFELTRDVAGQGWSLRKGTQLVGVVRGGEADRAYISLIGYIDPASNKLVKLGGDLLSGDGGSGLKGKRKKVGSAWGRALGTFARGVGRVANGAAQVAIGNAVGGSNAIRPVFISDAYGGGIVTLPTDLGGTARDNSYIEVKAGTSAYLLVTDLPDSVKGVDAVTEMPPEQIAEFADVAAAKPALGISEEELSRLMSEGTDDDIRAALPRMSPQMRRIAEQVLANGRD